MGTIDVSFKAAIIKTLLEVIKYCSLILSNKFVYTTPVYFFSTFFYFFMPSYLLHLFTDSDFQTDLAFLFCCAYGCTCM